MNVHFSARIHGFHQATTPYRKMTFAQRQKLEAFHDLFKSILKAAPLNNSNSPNVTLTFSKTPIPGEKDYFLKLIVDNPTIGAAGKKPRWVYLILLNEFKFPRKKDRRELRQTIIRQVKDLQSPSTERQFKRRSIVGGCMLMGGIMVGQVGACISGLEFVNTVINGELFKGMSYGALLVMAGITTIAGGAYISRSD